MTPDYIHRLAIAIVIGVIVAGALMAAYCIRCWVKRTVRERNVRKVSSELASRFKADMERAERERAAQFRVISTSSGKRILHTVSSNRVPKHGPFYSRHIDCGHEDCDGWDPDRCCERMCKSYEACLANSGRVVS